MSVYEVFNGDPPEIAAQKSETRAVFEKGVFAYHAGRFAEARQFFESLGSIKHRDPPIDIYRRRCERSLLLGTLEDAASGA